MAPNSLRWPPDLLDTFAESANSDYCFISKKTIGAYREMVDRIDIGCSTSL